jgi:Right handed beta helix region
MSTANAKGLKMFCSRRAGVVTSLLVIAASTHAATQCLEFPQLGTVGAVLTKPGNHCMTRDLVVKLIDRWWVWEGSRYKSESQYALVLGASDIVVDLQGKAIRSNAGALLSGVLGSVVADEAVTPAGVIDFTQRGENTDWSEVNRNITIKNGSVELRFPSYKTDYGPLGILLATDREPYRIHGFERDRLFLKDFNYLPRDRRNYPNRKITLENLTIRAPGYGIAVFGAGTVIRNCTIVTESGVGIWSFGGGAVIENNTITVRRNKRLTKTFLPTDAAIVLQDGHDSIVRNNVMHLEADGVGISLVSSSNVSMSNNVSKGWLRSGPAGVRDFR